MSYMATTSSSTIWRGSHHKLICGKWIQFHHFQDTAYSETSWKLETWGIFQFWKTIFNPDDVQAPHRWLDQNGSYLAFLVYSNSSVLPTKADVSESATFGHTSLFLQQHQVECNWGDGSAHFTGELDKITPETVSRPLLSVLLQASQVGTDLKYKIEHIYALHGEYNITCM